ncbi:MAG: hypothetical protein G01um101418_819 [Parcubacteria group bacterium Gr01-1014_18]|nr:MAG: hypothetical protein Greene041636_801 [Parcubacteria group bacterium Greene0416_36]TSC80016.1 MAG: hypothetical protein G01um101418_819 [Parcubacteria group bacterium Gr01-1014_18]TSC98116.1 MAG: hypothetical protein Greene101420_887 [Parcubacteria group bacterium Greene1014_20]TSD06632.1 MAG: hypothetical protein Greene07142_771 [Parcubacteria group bacterium Greene0714_2]
MRNRLIFLIVLLGFSFSSCVSTNTRPVLPESRMQKMSETLDTSASPEEEKSSEMETKPAEADESLSPEDIMDQAFGEKEMNQPLSTDKKDPDLGDSNKKNGQSEKRTTNIQVKPWRSSVNLTNGEDQQLERIDSVMNEILVLKDSGQKFTDEEFKFKFKPCPFNFPGGQDVESVGNGVTINAGIVYIKDNLGWVNVAGKDLFFLAFVLYQPYWVHYEDLAKPLWPLTYADIFGEEKAKKEGVPGWFFWIDKEWLSKNKLFCIGSIVVATERKSDLHWGLLGRVKVVGECYGNIVKKTPYESDVYKLDKEGNVLVNAKTGQPLKVSVTGIFLIPMSELPGEESIIK